MLVIVIVGSTEGAMSIREMGGGLGTGTVVVAVG